MKITRRSDALDKVFGENLRAFMDERGLSAIQVGKDIQVTKVSVYEWMRGLKVPMAGNYQALCDTYGLPYDYFYRQSSKY